MKHFRNNNHYTTYGWMLDKLGLRDARLTIYAIVYSFSQDGETEFYGGRKYMAEASGRSLPTVDRVLNELEKDGLIKKFERVNDGVSHCRYSVYLDENGEGIFNPDKKENDDNTTYHDDNTPYHDDNTHINNKDNKEKKDNNKLLSKKSSDKEPSLFTEEPTEEDKFNSWFQLKFPVLSKNKRPMTLKKFKALEAEQFTDEQIINKLDYMEARKRFNHDYTDVYRVCRNWLLSDRDPNYRDRFRNNKKKEEPKTQQQ